MANLLVLDFEGTSRLASARATEIGCVQLSSTFKSEIEFETLVNPQVSADASALSVSRLSKKEIAAAPEFGEIWPVFSTFLNDKIVVAHNKIYETNVLRNELRTLGIKELPPMICTLEWSRQILGHKVPNYTLGSLCSYFDIDFHDAHEAIGDARATARLFMELCKLSSDLRTEIRELSPSVIQYKGTSRKSAKPVIRERFHAIQGDKALIKRAKDRVLIMSKSLVVITGTPDDGKEAFGEYLAEVNLEYRETPPTKGTAFVVQSNNSPGMSKIRRAIELDIPVLSEADCLTLIKTLRG